MAPIRYAGIFLDPPGNVVGIAVASRDRERLTGCEDVRTDDGAVVDCVAYGEVDAGAASDVAHRREAVSQHRLRVANAVDRRFGNVIGGPVLWKYQRQIVRRHEEVSDVRVAVDQARHDRCVAQFDDACTAAGISRAHRNDAIAADDEDAGRAHRATVEKSSGSNYRDRRGSRAPRRQHRYACAGQRC